MSGLHPIVSAVQDGHCALLIPVNLVLIFNPTCPRSWPPIQHVLHCKLTISSMVPELSSRTMPYYPISNFTNIKLLPQYEKQHPDGSQVPTAYICDCLVDIDFFMCLVVWSCVGSLDC